MKKYCIIPARSGSKGLKNKNITLLNGKPLVVYTVEAALNSGLFEKQNIIFTTDSNEYADIVRPYGINIHLRDESTSHDKAPSSSFILEILNNVIDEDCQFFLLQPTSPLRGFQNVIEASEQFVDCTSLISVTKSDKSPRLLAPIEEGYIPKLDGVDKNYTRQAEVDYYYPNGAIYITSKKEYLKNMTFYSKNTKAYVMDKISSTDIDTIDDLELAKYYLSNIDPKIL